MPRYELREGRSSKFWTIELTKTGFVTTYGRIGTDGQSSTKKLGPAEAKAAYDKLVAEKTDKGYKLVGDGAGQIPLPPPAGTPSVDFGLAFKSGHVFRDDKATYAVKVVEVAKLTVASGKIVAADPFTLHRAIPFERTVKRGAYPVSVSVADIKYPKNKSNNQKRVGSAMVRFASGTPMKWINATKKGQKLSALEPGHSYCYGVDAGAGCFADHLAIEALEYLNRVEFANDNWEGYLLGKTERDLSDPSWGASRITDPETKTNVVVFPSGWGDGSYATYWGLSKSGAPLCLATDFGVYPRT